MLGSNKISSAFIFKIFISSSLFSDEAIFSLYVSTFDIKSFLSDQMALKISFSGKNNLTGPGTSFNIQKYIDSIFSSSLRASLAAAMATKTTAFSMYGVIICNIFSGLYFLSILLYDSSALFFMAPAFMLTESSPDLIHPKRFFFLFFYFLFFFFFGMYFIFYFYFFFDFFIHFFLTQSNLASGNVLTSAGVN